MNKLLSVIVPIYKVEKYINKCLDSLLLPRDLMERVEVLMVNDGTPDNSAMMAKEYQKKYPLTFRLINKENGGHGSAWNRGVKEATGKYIRFLDSDDWLTNFEEFVRKLENYDVDLVFTNLALQFQDTHTHQELINNVMEGGKVYHVNEYDWNLTRNLFSGHNFTNFHMCTYRTQLLKECHPLFLEKAFYDDEILYIMPLCKAKTFCFINVILYNYLLGRIGQTVGINISTRNIDFYTNVRKQGVMFAKTHSPKSKNVKEEIVYILNSRLGNLIYYYTKLSFNEFNNRMSSLDIFIKENFKDYKPNNIHKRYIKNGAYFTWCLYKYVIPLITFLRK